MNTQITPFSLVRDLNERLVSGCQAVRQINGIPESAVFAYMNGHTEHGYTVYMTKQRTYVLNQYGAYVVKPRQ